MANISPLLNPGKDEVRFKTITTPCEWVENYRSGGYHPVHFGDLFKNGQYKVVRKLGWGSFSTVWLAVDQRYNCFVALKILVAEMSKTSKELMMHKYLSKTATTSSYITKIIDNFQHEGLNGTHLCLVFEPMGPSANTMVEELPCSKPRHVKMKIQYPTWMAKNLLKQALHGLEFLHLNNIAHGDFQPGNMLFMVNLNSVGTEELEQDDNYQYGAISPPVERLDGKLDKHAPRYLAVPQPLASHVSLDYNFKVKVSDLGASFFFSDPPKKVVTPRGLRAPELILGRINNKSIDVWSFGCLIFEFITGQPLFCVPGYSSPDKEDDDHLLQLSDVLGPLPDHLYRLWSRSSNYFTSDRVQYNSFFGSVPEETDLLSAKMEPLEQYFDSSKPEAMTGEEAKAVIALLRRILQYDPAKRPTPSEILDDLWLSM